MSQNELNHESALADYYLSFHKKPAFLPLKELALGAVIAVVMTAVFYGFFFGTIR
jgi:hypothetical protein